MKKTVIIIVLSFLGIVVTTFTIFGIRYQFKRAEIQEAQQRETLEKQRQLQETKHCEEIIQCFDGKIKDEERTQLMNVNGDLEKTRQFLLLMCENRYSHWDLRIQEINQKFEQLEQLNQEAKDKGIWAAPPLQAAEARVRTKLNKDRQLAEEQKNAFLTNFETIKTWQPNPYH